MPAQTILFRMPLGKVGAVTRLWHTTTEAGLLAAETEAGLPVMLDTTATPRKFVVATTPANIYGFLTRSYPTMTANDQSVYDNTGATAIPIMRPDLAVSIMKFGYMSVQLRGDDSVEKGDAVFMRTANATADVPIGSLVAPTDPDGTAIPNCIFNGPALPGEAVEIIYKS